MLLPGTSKPSTMAKCIGALLWNTRPIAPAMLACVVIISGPTIVFADIGITLYCDRTRQYELVHEGDHQVAADQAASGKSNVQEPDDFPPSRGFRPLPQLIQTSAQDIRLDAGLDERINDAYMRPPSREATTAGEADTWPSSDVFAPRKRIRSAAREYGPGLPRRQHDIGPISRCFASWRKKRSARPAFSDVLESLVCLVERLADSDGKTETLLLDERGKLRKRCRIWSEKCPHVIPRALRQCSAG